ncbi:MAG: hypothetical protein IPO09_20590 [Anaeromyxobacter sp.]|nr:hypothetical protein [Anaeromyxobacter sp.]
MTSIDLEATRQQLASWSVETKTSESGFVVPGPAGDLEVGVESVDVPTIDGHRYVQVVRIEQTLPQLQSWATPETVGSINKLASSTALVSGRAGLPPALVAKIPILLGDDDAAANLYPFLVAVAAYAAKGWAYYLLPGSPSIHEFLLTGVVPDLKFFGIHEAAPVGVAPELEVGRQWAVGRGFATTAGENWLNTEFPWDEGAISSSVTSDRATSLVEISTSERHPVLGQGLTVRLRLPVALPPEGQAIVADELNHWERDHVDMVPSLGAWAPDPQVSSVAFRAFFATAFSPQVYVRNMVWWMAGRAWRAKRWLVAAGVATERRLADG